MIRLIVDQLRGKIMKQFVVKRLKMYSYLMNDGHVNKRANDTKKCVIKQKIRFEAYESCLLSNMTTL